MYQKSGVAPKSSTTAVPATAGVKRWRKCHSSVQSPSAATAYDDSSTARM